MSRIKKMTTEELLWVRQMYLKKNSDLRTIQRKINVQREKLGLEKINSSNTIKYFLKQEGIYIPVKNTSNIDKDKLIQANKETRKKICEHFGVSNANVSQVLRFQRNSKAAIAMRKMAIENGASLYEKKKDTLKNIYIV